MKKLLLLYIIILSSFLSCTQNKKHEKKGINLSETLTRVDNNQDKDALKQILHSDVIIYIPNAPPIYSKEVVIDLFNYLWSKTESSNISYILNSIKKNENSIVEKGIYSYNDADGVKNEMPYTIKSINDKVIEVIYDNSKKPIIKLPKPTGSYGIGQSIHYYEEDRPIAFQIWYPTLENSEDKIQFQSKDVAEAISNFLRWPSFNNSFTRLMKSNSIKDAHVVANSKFPVLIYNHGYGGATPVYQTVFEELVSHGYIVVSIGHKDESAFLLKEDSSVVQNSPDNEFYTKRTPEISNRVVGIEQSVILNTDNLEELTKAYKKLVELTPLHTESVDLWVLDTKNVIKKLEEINNQNKYLKGGFDFNNMGVFGHSVGGATAGEFGSKTIFKAGINLDGFQFGNLINSKLQIPFLFISSNEEANRYLKVSPFASNSEFDTYHAIIKGFSHSSFSDLQLFSPNGVSDIKLQRALILGFFNKYLKNEKVGIAVIENQYVNLKINKLK
jgi:predicted dienelactone hydrolase